MNRLEEKFWKYVTFTEECWVWTGAPNARGYGLFRYQGKTHGAHRMSYEISNGPVPEGLVVDHICHNTLCVKPAHLRAVTHKQNLENLTGATKRSKTGIRGVSLHRRSKLYRAQVGHNNKIITVGHFRTVEEAEAAVIAKRNELFTHNDADRRAA